MSQLLHFKWDGRECSVSIERNKHGYSLVFVDPAIVTELGGKVLIARNNDQWEFFTATTQKQSDMMSSILPAIEKSVGRPLTQTHIDKELK